MSEFDLIIKIATVATASHVFLADLKEPDKYRPSATRPAEKDYHN